MDPFRYLSLASLFSSAFIHWFARVQWIYIGCQLHGGAFTHTFIHTLFLCCFVWCCVCNTRSTLMVSRASTNQSWRTIFRSDDSGNSRFNNRPSNGNSSTTWRTKGLRFSNFIRYIILFWISKFESPVYSWPLLCTEEEKGNSFAAWSAPAKSIMRHYNFEWNGIILYWYYLTYRSAWLQEHENASLPVIRRRMEFVTGLIFKAETASEYFQVVLFFFCKGQVDWKTWRKTGFFLRLLITALVACTRHTPTMSFTRMSDRKIRTLGTCMLETELPL